VATSFVDTGIEGLIAIIMLVKVSPQKQRWHTGVSWPTIGVDATIDMEELL
jgi:hypothetical protein